MNRHSDDYSLVQKTIKQPEYFSEIIDRYQGPLNQFIYRIGVNDSDDREDILQETFIKAYKNLNSVDPKQSFSAWLYRIARNTVYDAHRKNKSRGIKREFTEEEADIFWNSIPDTSQDIESTYQSKERSSEVRKALQMLPEKYKEALILFFLEEKSYTEISEILLKNENSVATLISRGKKILKKNIEKNFSLLS